MKINILASHEPWTTWQQALYKSNTDLFLYSDLFRHNIVNLVEWRYDVHPYLEEFFTMNKNIQVVLYVGSITDDHVPYLNEAIGCISPQPIILVPNREVGRTISNHCSLGYIYWSPPSSIPDKMVWDGGEVLNKTDDFIVVSNVEKREDKIEEIVKAFFSTCMEETEDGELIGNNDLHIYSAQELPVEPFNNLYFNGLQPNPIVYKHIKRAKLLISPYAGNGFSMSVFNAIKLGTPVLIKETNASLDTFGLPDDRFFITQKELKSKLKYFSELDFTSKEYHGIIETNMKAFYKRYGNDIEGIIRRNSGN